MLIAQILLPDASSFDRKSQALDAAMLAGRAQAAFASIADAEVRAADELWLTSSTREVLPIVRLDARPIGTGAPGPAFARMYDWYRDFKRRTMRG